MRMTSAGGLSTARLKQVHDVMAGHVESGDPKENLTGILLTQRMMDSPQSPRAMVDFRTCVHQAIDD
jgi:hypothetical protein